MQKQQHNSVQSTKWKVEGVDHKSGASRTVYVEGTDSPSAVRAARLIGVFASKVVPTVTPVEFKAKIAHFYSSSLSKKIALGLIFLLTGVALYLWLSRDNWESRHQQTILDRLVEARELDAAENENSAIAKYQDTFNFIGDHSIEDDALRSSISDAHYRYKQLLKMAGERERLRIHRDRELVAQTALEKQRQVHEKEERDRLKQEQDRLARIRGTISGAAWINLPTGESLLLRGMNLTLVRSTFSPQQSLVALSDDVNLHGNKLIASWRTELTKNEKEAGEKYTRAISGKTIEQIHWMDQITTNGIPSEASLKAIGVSSNEYIQILFFVLARNLKTKAEGYRQLVSEHQIAMTDFSDAMKVFERQATVDIAAFNEIVRKTERIFAKGLRFHSLVLAGTAGDVDAVWPQIIEDDSIWLAVQQKVAFITGATNIDAKFEILNIPRGNYYLIAYYRTNTFAVEWILPVEIKDDARLSVDLNNETVKNSWIIGSK